MRKKAIERFVANGGNITKCPPARARVMGNFNTYHIYILGGSLKNGDLKNGGFWRPSRYFVDMSELH